jgi:F0F1-type ATP synthase epsilon subunit
MKPDTKQHAGKQKSDDKREIMRIKLYSPFQTYFNGDAYSISGENKTGPFDILPRHHNFMTLLDAGELSIKSPDGDLRVKISRGIMHVKENQTIVFLDV